MAPVLGVRETLWGMEWSAHSVPRAYKLEMQALFGKEANLDAMLIVPTCQHATVDLVQTGEAIEQEKDFCLERFMEVRGAAAGAHAARPGADGARGCTAAMAPLASTRRLWPANERATDRVRLQRADGPACRARARARARAALLQWAKAVAGALQAAGHHVDYCDPCSGMLCINRSVQAVYGEVDALTTLLQYKTTNTGCCKVVHHPKWGTAVYPSTLFTTAPVDELVKAVETAETQLKQ